MHVGLKGSTQSSTRTTLFQLNAFAVLIKVPKLPGSEILYRKRILSFSLGIKSASLHNIGVLISATIPSGVPSLDIALRTSCEIVIDSINLFLKGFVLDKFLYFSPLKYSVVKAIALIVIESGSSEMIFVSVEDQ